MSLFLVLTCITSFAQTTQPFAINTYGNVTLSQEKLITDTFLYLNKFWSDQGKSLSANITKEYFTPDTTLIINGKTVYTGYNQFRDHFKEVGKSIVGKIHFPLLEVIGVDNKLIINFDEDIYDKNGNNYPANVMAIFTLQDNKIKEWKEVAYTKYFCQAASSSVVYSK